VCTPPLPHELATRASQLARSATVLAAAGSRHAPVAVRLFPVRIRNKKSTGISKNIFSIVNINVKTALVTLPLQVVSFLFVCIFSFLTFAFSVHAGARTGRFFPVCVFFCFVF
jgi:hypothetical protein